MQRNPTATGTAIPASLSVRPSLLENGVGATEATPCVSLQTIAVLLDGSAAAEHALPHAVSLARRTGATLRLIRVFSRLDDIEPWHFSQAAAGIKPSKQQRQHYLANLAWKITRFDEPADRLEIDTVLIDSPDTISALATGAAGADLVVIGSRRRRLAARLWWLNTVDRLRRQLSAPLLLTTGYAGPLEFSDNLQFEKILVPLDGTVLAANVLDSAAQVARLHEGSLTLLNVQNEHWSLGGFEHTDPHGYLVSQLDHLRRTGVQAAAEVLTTRDVTSDSAAQTGRAIASYAGSGAFDLIAIATRGDHGWSRMLRGSVSDHLLRNTRLPILLQNVPARAERRKVTTIA